MILINRTRLQKLNLRSLHNHSGECGDYEWKVIDWHENEEYCSKYDYKVQFTWKRNGRSVGTHMFYGIDVNGILLNGSVIWIIYHYISQRKRPPRTDLSTTLYPMPN